MSKVYTLLLCVAQLLFVVCIFSGCDIGYKNEEGVLDEGTLVEYRSEVSNRNKTGTSILSGKRVAVNEWSISYVDVNGKFGACDHYTAVGAEPPKINQNIKCDKQKLN